MIVIVLEIIIVIVIVIQADHSDKVLIITNEIMIVIIIVLEIINFNHNANHCNRVFFRLKIAIIVLDFMIREAPPPKKKIFF